MESIDSHVTEEEEDLQGDLSSGPFDDDGYMGFDPKLPSQRFDSFQMQDSNYGGSNPYISSQSRDLSATEEEEDGFPGAKLGSDNGGFNSPPMYQNAFNDHLGDEQGSPAMPSPYEQSFESRYRSEFAVDSGISPSADSDGKDFGPFDDDFAQQEADPIFFYPPPSDPPNGTAILPPPDEMQPEEGFILREWKWENGIHLEERARLEQEKLSKIIDAADIYKDEFLEKRKMQCESSKRNNQDREKLFLENLVNFHATAEKHYWKAVSELIPHELPAFESKSKAGKDKKKPSVVVNHGPKPGKATDLARMRQVLVKLKHNPPAYMKSPLPPAQLGAQGAEDSDAKPATSTVALGAENLEKQGSIPVIAAA